MPNNMAPWYYGRLLPTFDLAASGLFTGVFGLLYVKAPCPIDELISRDSTALYGTLLSSFAVLLGFAIAAIAIVASLVTAKPFDTLRRSSEYDNFWLAFKWSIRSLAVAAVFSLVALFSTRYNSARIATLFLEVFCAVAAILSLLRSGYTLEKVLRRTRDFDRKATVRK